MKFPKKFKLVKRLVILLNINLISIAMSDNIPYFWKPVRDVFQECTILILSEGRHPNEASQNVLRFHCTNDKLIIGVSNDRNVSSVYDMTDVHQLRSDCVAAFVAITIYSASNAEILYKHLLSMGGVVKTDEDFFIFHSMSETALVSLFSRGSIASGIKSKIGIKLKQDTLSNNNDLSPKYYATCFFCAAGNSSLNTFYTENLNYSKNTSDNVPFENTAIHSLFPDLLKSFHGKRFKISYPVLAKWLIEIRETSPGHWGYKRGVMNFALDHLMRKYNFSAEYFPSIGGGTGSKLPNGSWVGTVGDVLSGRTEIGQCTGQIYARNLVVGFAFPTVYEWLTFTTGEPQPHYSWKSMYWPFTPLLWLLVAVSVIVAFFSMSFLFSNTDQVNVAGNIIFLYRTLLQQEAGKFEKTTTSPTRMFLAFWLIFVLIIATSYRSKLVSFLDFPVVKEPPKTFESLAKTSYYHIALQFIHGAAYSFIQNSPDPIFQAIFKRMELEESDAKCFQQVVGTHYSCISWNSVANYVYHKNLSDKYGNVPLIKARDTTSFIVVGLIFPKRAVFRLKFDAVLCTAMSMGLTWKWKELDYKFIRNERKRWEVATNKSQMVYARISKDVLTMQNLSGIFFIVIANLVISIGIFTGEFLVWNKRKGKRGHRLYVYGSRPLEITGKIDS